MKSRITIMVILMYAVFALPAFALQSDEVRSRHIDEADGTSGQNTNSGSGVKTGHIQDGAVTPAKIGFYKNVRVVAPSGGDFTNPVDALNAISDASATNPYLVKIMPGVYNIGANSVQMKQFVDIEGSGENNTVISSSVNAPTPSTATLIVTNNASVKNLKVSNIGNDGGIAILFNSGTAAAEGVTAEAMGNGTGTKYAICISGASVTVILNNINALAEGSDFENHGIGILDGAFARISNVRSEAIGGNAARAIYVLSDSGGADITNSEAVAMNASNCRGIALYLGQTNIKGSKVSAIGGGATTIGIDLFSGNVMNSEIYTSGDSVVYGSYGDINFASSLIEGGIIDGNKAGVGKVVNCWDQNYNPLPNR